MHETKLTLEPFPGLEGVELVQKTPIFKSLGFEDTLKLMTLVRREQRAKGDVIVEQDSLGQALYVIRSGQVDTYRDDGGDRRLLRSLGPGEHFGEMSIIDDQLTSADVVVASDQAELLVITRVDFDRMVQESERFAAHVYKAFCRTLAARLRDADRRSDGS